MTLAWPLHELWGLFVTPLPRDDGDPAELEALLQALARAIAKTDEARRTLEAEIEVRNAMIVALHRSGDMGYRRLAERTGLSVPRIQQIVGASSERPMPGPFIQRCPDCGNDAYAIGINERFCPACGWNWSGE
jgi:hypothetical protein